MRASDAHDTDRCGIWRRITAGWTDDDGGLLLEAGFSEATTERAVNLLYGFIVGFVALEAPRRMAPVADLFQEQSAVQAAYQAIDRADLPNTMRVAPQVERFIDDEQFTFGLTAILDGLETQRPRPSRAATG